MATDVSLIPAERAVPGLAQTPIRADERWEQESIRYSICTIVTRLGEYKEMVDSFKAGGFREPECEFLYLDNSQRNTFDAYSGNNLFLNAAKGQYIILCHQDILLIKDGRAELDLALDRLSRLDPNWAACGNAGIEYPARLVLRITDPHGEDQRVGDFPVPVRSLDENFIIVRRAANLAFSHDLEGFHFFGTDICIIADILGGRCYVIDFHLLHKSAGVMDSAFLKARQRLVLKYRHALRSRWIATTCHSVFISGVPGLGRLLSCSLPTRITLFVARRMGWLSRIMFRS
jgi:hypothetical protein